MANHFFLTILRPLLQLIPFFITPAKHLPARAPLAAQKTGPRRRVIVDTDMSHDDVVALLYLLQHPALDIVGITVVNGVTRVSEGVENVRRLLALAGRPNIPVAGGPNAPLAGGNAFPEFWRWFEGGLFRLRCSPPGPASSIDAPNLIRALTAESPTQIIALGPLTNIALALQADPSLAGRLASIVIGGGAVYVPGCINEEDPANPNRVAEWNVWADPQAADIVFRSGAKLVVIPLDVTHLTGPRPLLISRQLVNELAANCRWREVKLITLIMRGLFLVMAKGDTLPVWDLAIAALSADPALGVDWRDLCLRVVTGAPNIAGQTVVDEAGQPNARVCLAGDQAAFAARLKELFDSAAP